MRKLILLVHTSLDGFVAGRNGELDGFEQGEENLRFVCKLTETADTAFFGRISYQLLDNWWPTAKDRAGATQGEIAFSNWYNHAIKNIVSTTLPKGNSDNIKIISENIVDEVVKLKEQPGKEILIFGSPSVSQLLMQNGLIDSYWIFINPTIFGEGISLFKGSEPKTKLNIVATKQFPNGEIGHNYVLEI
jgi:dihydrofolate reductase